jgi:hypothetical protein
VTGKIAKPTFIGVAISKGDQAIELFQLPFGAILTTIGES